MERGGGSAPKVVDSRIIGVRSDYPIVYTPQSSAVQLNQELAL